MTFVQALSPAGRRRLFPRAANCQSHMSIGHTLPAVGPARNRPLLPRRHSSVCGLQPPRALPGLPSNLAEQLPGDSRSELTAWLTLAGYAANFLSQGRLTISPELLYSALAWYSLAWCSLSLVTNTYEFDRAGAVIAPGFLATRALPVLASRVAPLDTATALFGYFLARDLPVPIWASLPALALAIFSGFGPHAAVALFGLNSAWKLIEGVRRGGIPPLQHLAFAALAAWGLYSGQAQLLAVLVFLGQLGASAIS